MTTYILLAAIVVPFLLVMIIPKKRNEKPESPDDELLFERETGTQYSVDEIVDGEVRFEDNDDVKTEAQLEKLYSEGERDIQRAKNSIRKKGFKKVDFPEQESDLKIFESIPWWENYTHVQTDSVYQLSSGSYLFFMSLSYTITVGKGGRAVATDVQPMLWLRGPTPLQVEALEAIRGIGHVEARGNHFFIINKIATPDLVASLLDALKFRNFTG